jgi:hypothetical protein
MLIPIPNHLNRIYLSDMIVSSPWNGYDEFMIRERKETDHEDPPPFFRTWNRLYVCVVCFTCALIFALYLMTRLLNR